MERNSVRELVFCFAFVFTTDEKKIGSMLWRCLWISFGITSKMMTMKKKVDGNRDPGLSTSDA
jgi:hypothetical protein